jgi:dolichol-phosphate mannosyltransferase
MKKAIVIIPTYNESENIQKVVPLLAKVFTSIKGWQMGVLVVDDSSPDGTAKTVKELQKKYSFLHLLINPHKSGLGGAYLKGMKEAFYELKADVVFEFDADLSHDPERIPDFLRKLDEGYDMVLGSRYIPGGGIPDNWGLHRKFLSVVGNLVINFVFLDFRIRDWTGGYRAITKKVYEDVVPELQSERFTGYTFQMGFLHQAVKKGYKITEVPFKFIDRTIGESKLGFEYLKNSLMFILKIRFHDIVNHQIFKFAVVGGIGFTINLIGLEAFHRFFGIDSGTAAALGAEVSIVSNFILNNFWTFSTQKVSTPVKFIGKFIQFNIASLGAVIIQKVVVGTGTHYTSDNLRLVWFVLAVAIGMVVNYTIYSKVIWKKTAKTQKKI